jgi:hypothetical protein
VLDDAHHHDEAAPGERHFHEGGRDRHGHGDGRGGRQTP